MSAPHLAPDPLAAAAVSALIDAGRHTLEDLWSQDGPVPEHVADLEAIERAIGFHW